MTKILMIIDKKSTKSGSRASQKFGHLQKADKNWASHALIPVFSFLINVDELTSINKCVMSIFLFQR